MTPREAIESAVAMVGGTGALAAALKIKPPSVSEWLKRGVAPPARCIDIELAVGGQVTRHDLRPDVFGPPPVASDEANSRSAA